MKQKMFEVENLTTVVPTAGNLSGTIEVRELSSLADVCEPDDGEIIRFQRYEFKIYTSGRKSHAILPIIVQTSGTITEGVQTTVDNVDAWLAAAINADFAWEPLAEPRHSKIEIHSTAGENYYTVSLACKLPQKFINIMNRLQREEEFRDNLFILLLTASTTADTGLTSYRQESYDYDVIAQRIKIR